MYDQLVREVSAAFYEQGALPFHVGIGDATGGLPRAAILSLLHQVIPREGITLQVYGPGKVNGLPPCNAMMGDFTRGSLDGIVRGTLPSNDFLIALLDEFSLKTTRRLAMLATASMQDFFFAPVGIDEGFTSEQKAGIVDACAWFLPRMGITPSFFLLSAGRSGDRGRHEVINRSIEETCELVQRLEAIHAGLRFIHGEILVENALETGANVIIAPDGVSGNLMYRTLIHLGAGISRGAWYLDEAFPGPVMDTSRVGPVSEHAGAILLAARSWLASCATR